MLVHVYLRCVVPFPIAGDNVTEITSSNRPREVIFDRFFDPLMTIKEQLKAMNLSEDEERYLCKLVLTGDSEHVKVWNVGSPPASDLKHAQAEALARRSAELTISG